MYTAPSLVEVVVDQVIPASEQSAPITFWNAWYPTPSDYPPPAPEKVKAFVMRDQISLRIVTCVSAAP
jgi:hypothetical protein